MLLAVLLAVWSSAASGQAFMPGAPGAGDPYFPLDGNGGYNVRNYGLELKYDPATDLLVGRAKIRARTTQNLSSFNLDLVGLTVHSVTVNGRPAAFAHDGGELVITPESGLPKSRSFIVVIEYSGVPVSLEGAGFIHTDDGALVVGEPHSASSWFPVNDHPTDKASYTFAITVPEGLTAVANGTLERQRTTDGWTTWYWRQREPMASYLTTATIGEFDLRAYSVESIRYWDAVDPDVLSGPFASRVEAGFALQPEIIEFLASHFAKYPFRAGGGIVDDVEGLGFALENQTRPIYAIEFFDDPLDAELVFVHEIAHQWFGDSLSVARWQHIWLNEGFATYMTWLWREEKHGYSAQESFDLYYFGIPLEDEGDWKGFWQGIVGDPGPEEVFGLPVYLRGAMTLHQLRLAVGDPTFFAILKRWTQERKGDNVTTDEFIALAEKVSGVELSDLFQTWLFTPERPALPQPLGAARSATSDPSSSIPVPWQGGLRP
ncbi:MAG TPA: M1 family metallopeptidase [Candidatus Binatia bacterium]|nr:M1 family metallopeptidase [Candidatus Binatia bacterium]